MPQTQIACPRCRQTIPAQVEQLFDVTADPAAKQRLVGGISNRARCPFCGYDGNLSTPIVYHDAAKELLLTYFPAELGLPANEQEKLIGPLINKVVNNLPAEKRKAYLFRPQAFLTYQSMVEKILEGDGVSKEMLDEQQKRLNLIQRLLQITTADVRAEVIKQEAALLDEAFFALFDRLVQAAVASKQQQTAQMMGDLQEELLEGSEYGRKLKAQFGELEAAIQSLQEVGKELTREKLLEILIAAPNAERVQALVSMTRNGLDYSFFQILTAQLEKSTGEQRAKLEDLRNKILDYTNQLDKAMEAQMKQADAFIEKILAAPDVAQATAQNIEQFNNDIIAQALETKLREASQKKDADRLDKIQKVVSVLQQASAPPELELINELLESSGDEASLQAALKAHEPELTEEFPGVIASLMQQIESQGEKSAQNDEIMRRLDMIYGAVLKMSMQKNLGK
ncbi:MAG: CpXC domain-containing protein [Anaerolineales bacterium]